MKGGWLEGLVIVLESNAFILGGRLVKGSSGSVGKMTIIRSEMHVINPEYLANVYQSN